MSCLRHLEKPIKTKENKRKHFFVVLFIVMCFCFYMFLLVFPCFFRRRQQVNNEVKHINRRLESLFFLLYLRCIERIYNGFTTALERSCLVTANLCLLTFDFCLLSEWHCKITTIFADVPTNYGKIHVRFEKSAFYARNLLIHREKFSEGIFKKCPI